MPTPPTSFDDFINMASQGYPNMANWGEFTFKSWCTKGGKGGKGRGGKGERDGPGGGMIDWDEPKDRIIMTGADGSKLYIEMGATKVAASVAATLGAMSLW